MAGNSKVLMVVTNGHTMENGELVEFGLQNSLKHI